MLKPLGSHVVVEPVVQEEKTASGIFLPDTAAKEKPQQGKVIAVGCRMEDGQMKSCSCAWHSI